MENDALDMAICIPRDQHPFCLAFPLDIRVQSTD